MNDWTTTTLKVERKYKCEHENCRRNATKEYLERDEDGEVYYTLRCESHPAEGYCHEV